MQLSRQLNIADSVTNSVLEPVDSQIKLSKRQAEHDAINKLVELSSPADAVIYADGVNINLMFLSKSSYRYIFSVLSSTLENGNVICNVSSKRFMSSDGLQSCRWVSLDLSKIAEQFSEVGPLESRARLLLKQTINDQISFAPNLGKYTALLARLNDTTVSVKELTKQYDSLKQSR